MEINNSMENLNSYIKVFDNFWDKKVLNSFLKVCKNDVVYKPSIISTPEGEFFDKNVRDVGTYNLSNIHSKSLTLVHWASYVNNRFQQSIEYYKQLLNIHDQHINISNIQILKYKIGGHYVFHVDHCAQIPRTLSLVYFLNDNYEGGNLCFKVCNSEKIIEIEKVANRLIVWPSNFMFSHTVTPVKKGERYSVVSWAL